MTSISPKKHLFWFIKEDTKLDIDKPFVLDRYLQQILSYGTEEDVKDLFKLIGKLKFKESFLRLKKFLKPQVRAFWESFVGSY